MDTDCLDKLNVGDTIVFKNKRGKEKSHIVEFIARIYEYPHFADSIILDDGRTFYRHVLEDMLIDNEIIVTNK